MMTDTVRCDVLVVGSGMGGGALAHRLSRTGLDVLVVERGRRLPREAENWDAEHVFARDAYRTAEQWRDERTGRLFQPGVHYHVGGNTKFYGACLPRFREADFREIEHAEGCSPAWPIGYADLEPYYAIAESALKVHGDDTGDDTAPWRSAPYPYPALEHEPAVAELARAWSRQALRPVRMPIGIDLAPGGRCVRCATCDGFPCRLGAKSDAETRFIEPATTAGVRLLTDSHAIRVNTSDGSATSVVVQSGGTTTTVTFARLVLAAGAVNTAALLLRSGDDDRGIGNSSGLVGRNYMVHNSTFMTAIDPRRRNATAFQKTLGLNQWYSAGQDTPHPLGNVQMLGKLTAPMVANARPRVPRRLLRYATEHSIDLYLTTEDLPSAQNGVRIGRDGRIGIEWTPSNLAPHRELVRRMTGTMRTAGYPIVVTERMSIAVNSHMCGTAVMGADPATSVVDPTGRMHDLANVWIADSSVFPSSAAMNPALTIAAIATRTADHIALDAGAPTPPAARNV